MNASPTQRGRFDYRLERLVSGNWQSLDPIAPSLRELFDTHASTLEAEGARLRVSVKRPDSDHWLDYGTVTGGKLRPYAEN